MWSVRVRLGDGRADLDVLLRRLAGFGESVIARVKILSLLMNTNSRMIRLLAI
jgi:hypothetical protein